MQKTGVERSWTLLAGGTECMVVTKLIQSKTTKRFLTKDGAWTDVFQKAWAFKEMSEVEEIRRKLNLLDVETYYSFHECRPSAYDFTVPLFSAGAEAGEVEHSRSGGFRILLRQGQGYLQPSGEWSEARTTAREFASSLLAYWWAKEQQLLGVEVVMAYADGQPDFVSMRV